MKRSAAVLVFLAAVGTLVLQDGVRAAVLDAAWLQWGGPRRNFTAEAPPLANSWPQGGPRKLWERSLGEGHSTILVEGTRLYTMFRPLGVLSMVRRSQSETIAAFDAASGKTLWEHTYDSSTSGLNLSEGAGPHSTPLIVGDRLFAIGSRMELFALDKNTGKVLWHHDVIRDFGATQDDRGYSPAPISYHDTVIIPVGGKSSLIAFDQQSGAVRWKAGEYPVAPASPVLIKVDGQEQLVVSGANEIVGADPSNGAVLWRHPHKTEWGLNISTPVWGEGNLLFVVSRLQQRRAAPEVDAGGRQDDGGRAVVSEPDACPHRYHDPSRRLRGGVERRFRPMPDGCGRREERPASLAEPGVRAFDLPARGRKIDHPRRGR